MDFFADPVKGRREWVGTHPLLSVRIEIKSLIILNKVHGYHKGNSNK